MRINLNKEQLEQVLSEKYIGAKDFDYSDGYTSFEYMGINNCYNELLDTITQLQKANTILGEQTVTIISLNGAIDSYKQMIKEMIKTGDTNECD